MSIGEEEIKALARLAKLDFDAERCRDFAGGFAEIIAFANTVNTEIAGDASSIKEVGGEFVSYENLRGDEAEESLSNEKITSNVSAQDGYFPVGRVVK